MSSYARKREALRAIEPQRPDGRALRARTPSCGTGSACPSSRSAGATRTWNDSKRERLMLDRLATLTGTRPKRVIALAVRPLRHRRCARRRRRRPPRRRTPPTTRTPRASIAEERLEDAGFRETEAVVLIEGVDPERPRGARRVEASRPRRAGGGRRAVSGYLDTEDRGVRLARRRRHLPGGPARRRRRTTRSRTWARRSSRAFEGEEGVARRRQRRRPDAGERQGRVRPPARRADRLPDPVPALAAVLPQPRRRGAAAADRRARDRRHDACCCTAASELDDGLDLRAQPGRPGSASAWRSTTACSSSRATARSSRAPARA